MPACSKTAKRHKSGVFWEQRNKQILFVENRTQYAQHATLLEAHLDPTHKNLICVKCEVQT